MKPIYQDVSFLVWSISCFIVLAEGMYSVDDVIQDSRTPRKHHSNARNHIHHSHHHHHLKTHAHMKEMEHPRNLYSNDDNDNEDEEGNGKRRDSENGSPHFHYHQHFQHHHQRGTGERQTIEELESHQNSDLEEHPHQEDSPHYGRYGNPNKHNHNFYDQASCQLPESWKGKWFQSGLPNLVIDSISIEGKGVCYESSGDKFHFVEKGNCHRCIVINQRHQNVLEYKESPYCEDKDTLENLCLQIPGDAALYSLFRIDARPIPCPFRPPYSFSYNKGTGICKSPISHVDTCQDPSKLLLRYQACPDVSKSESTAHELQCLGHWKDSSYHFLVGKLNYQLSASDEDRYRCFIYETLKGQTIVKIAVSGDATCNGLTSPTEGAKTMTFSKVADSEAKCKFPNWVSAYNWHSLNGILSVKTTHTSSEMYISESSTTFNGGHQHQPGRGAGGIASSGNFGNSFSSSDGTGSPDNSLFSGGTRITCQASKEFQQDHVAIVAQHTQGCSTTTVCIHFYKRHAHVIELQIRKKGSGYYEDFDCGNPEALGPEPGPTSPYVTLLRAEAISQRCPYLGKYMTVGTSQDGRPADLCMGGGSIQQNLHGPFHSVVVGCGQRATMDFHSKCISQEPITSYECHGSWEENGTGFLIASPLSRSSTSARRFCFTYLETDEGLQFFSSNETCRRDVNRNIEGIWAFNLTVDGQCAEPMTAGARSTHCDLLLATLLALMTLGFLLPVTISNNTFVSLVLGVSDLFSSLCAKISYYYSFSSRISSFFRISTSTSLVQRLNHLINPDCHLVMSKSNNVQTIIPERVYAAS